ncbi:hypothetical protein [Pseudomonas sp. PDM19]|uniref:hypothetical protein n=1 Tax=Pseudomonas sp. PDM19 TaxID=2769272 RepID=UPI0017845132|nr:hypothetical protein [Pseudomonas sp. PDM19]MBD9629732.1 hypothetical protein [Pseudomonas sp. PDM19]
MSHPEELRRELTDGARGLLARGMITNDEWLELCDLVTGSYSFAIEQRAAELFHPASAYVVLDQSGQQAGKGSRGILAFDAAKDAPLQVKYGEGGTLQAFTGPAFNYLSGSIQGLVLTMENGRRFTLVEVGRYLRGGEYVEAITDPDGFRLLLDMIEVAHEAGNVARARHLERRAEVSPFRVCPSCRANFATQYDCAQCTGLGFIRVTV